MSTENNTKVEVIPKKYLLSFIMVTSLFSLWGFANDITNPLVAAFKDVFVISNAQSSWVQACFYGGYATMAIPAAIFIRKYSYRAGIILGLSLYACGAMLAIPAANMANFNIFLVAFYVITFGLAFLETTANPYILSMGDEKTATQRLNLAQAFNPIGSLTGMVVASIFILSNLAVEDFRSDVKGYNSELNGVSENVEEFNILPILKADPNGRVHDKNIEAYVIEKTAEKKAVAVQALEGYQNGAFSTPAELATYASEQNIPEADANFVDDYFSTPKGDALLPLEQVISKVEKFKIPNGDLINMALRDYKNGIIPSFTGKNHADFQGDDLDIISTPYMIIGFVVLTVLVLFIVVKLPHTENPNSNDHELHFSATCKRLFTNPRYVGGVIAQAFYVGAQIMCWTYIIQYGQQNLGMDKATAQNHNILAMVIFLCSRFICTFFLKFVSPGKLLAALSLVAIALCLGTIHLQGMGGIYCLILTSACMSLMFPTIYGIALEGVGPDAKLGSAGLIFAIVGGAFMPRLQGGIIDMERFMGTTGIRGSFYLPLICFIVIAIYGFLFSKRKNA
ncbi:L-fucose:H+ symporter permease [Persicirhabdus sediminis]|nr:L-fucose:H+ symporter permease [Persicirhabdus sediminis]